MAATPGLPFVLRYLSLSQRIEKWWRELHERLEKYFKVQLQTLKDCENYDPSSDSDRIDHCLVF